MTSTTATTATISATVAGVGLAAAVLFGHSAWAALQDVAPVPAGAAVGIQAPPDTPGSIAISIRPGTGDAVKASKDMGADAAGNRVVNIAPGTGDAIRASKDMGARSE